MLKLIQVVCILIALVAFGDSANAQGGNVRCTGGSCRAKTSVRAGGASHAEHAHVRHANGRHVTRQRLRN